MKTREIKFILIFSLTILFGCNQSNPANSQLPGSNTIQKPVKPASREIFVKSLGIMATIPTDHIKESSKNIFRMYSPDGNFEYYLTWEKTQTPDMMRRAFKAGMDMGNGMFSRYIGDVISLSENSEAFAYGIYLFENSTQILSGYEVHDWSSPNGTLVINVMGTMENAALLKDKAMSLYNSVRILPQEKVDELKAKLRTDRATMGRNEDEQFFFDKVSDHTLLNVQMYGGNPPLRSEQRFELCAGGNGIFEMKTGQGNGGDEHVSGKWDIMEDEDGVMLVVIKSSNSMEDKWVIGQHKSGNVTIGGVEFILHPKGSPEGPRNCE